MTSADKKPGTHWADTPDEIRECVRESIQFLRELHEKEIGSCPNDPNDPNDPKPKPGI